MGCPKEFSIKVKLTKMIFCWSMKYRILRFEVQFCVRMFSSLTVQYFLALSVFKREINIIRTAFVGRNYCLNILFTNFYGIVFAVIWGQKALEILFYGWVNGAPCWCVRLTWNILRMYNFLILVSTVHDCILNV